MRYCKSRKKMKKRRAASSLPLGSDDDDPMPPPLLPVAKRARKDPRHVEQWQFTASSNHSTVLQCLCVNAKGDSRMPLAIKWLRLPDDNDDDDDDSGITSIDAALDEIMATSLLGELALAKKKKHGLRHARTRVFPRLYGVARVAFTTTAGVPESIVSPSLSRSGLRKPALVLVEEFLDKGDLARVYDGMEVMMPQSHALLCFFELMWGLMAAHTRMGLLFIGDIRSANIMLKSRPTLDHGRQVHYRLRLLHPSDGTPTGKSLEWCYTVTPDTPQACFIDFGMSSMLMPQGVDRDAPDRHCTGEDFYDIASHYPPEVYFGQSKWRDHRSDVWQMGLVLFALLAARPGSSDSRTFDAHEIPVAEVRRMCRAVEDPPLEPLDDDAIDNEEAVADDEEEEDETRRFLKPQMRVEQRFTRLLRNHPQVSTLLDAHLEEQLQWSKRTGARVYERYVSLGLLQEELGNGWRPSVLDAHLAGYADDPFFKCLYHPLVARFWYRYILDPALPLRQFMRGMVASLSPEAYTTIRHMLTWNYKLRPTCQEVLTTTHAWMRREALTDPLPSPTDATGAILMEVQGRPPLRRDTFVHAPMPMPRRLQQHHDQLYAQEDQLRQSVTTSAPLESWGGLERMILHATSL